jgi:hypothetical protein
MTISFARHQFPPAIIRHAVWLYARFTLSYCVRCLGGRRGLRKLPAHYAAQRGSLQRSDAVQKQVVALGR